MIRSLTEDLSSRLRSSVAITSFSQCVEELVLNGLDAGASCIAVRVNLRQGRVLVIDNGHGIHKDDLKMITSRYSTSKCHDIGDLDNLCHYGFRGEALASIRDLCHTLEISTRQKHSSQTYFCSFLSGKSQGITDAKAPRPSFGTTITVTDLFHKLPVRKKCYNDVMEMELIRCHVEAIALMYPGVSFSLRNDINGNKLVQTQKTSSTAAVFGMLYGGPKSRFLKEISQDSGEHFVSGLISTESHHSRGLQFVYVNKRLVLKTKMHKLINQLLGRSGFGKRRGGGTPKQYASPSISPQKYSDRHGIYIINITSPLSAYDITFDPTKTLVEFKNWTGVLHLIEKTIKEFLHRNNLVICVGIVPNSQDSQCGDSPRNQDSQKDPEEDTMKGYGETISTMDLSNSLHSIAVKRPRLPIIPKTPLQSDPGQSSSATPGIQEGSSSMSNLVTNTAVDLEDENVEPITSCANSDSLPPGGTLTQAAIHRSCETPSSTNLPYATTQSPLAYMYKTTQSDSPEVITSNESESPIHYTKKISETKKNGPNIFTPKGKASNGMSRERDLTFISLPTPDVQLSLEAIRKSFSRGAQITPQKLKSHTVCGITPWSKIRLKLQQRETKKQRLDLDSSHNYDSSASQSVYKAECGNLLDGFSKIRSKLSFLKKIPGSDDTNVRCTSSSQGLCDHDNVSSNNSHGNMDYIVDGTIESGNRLDTDISGNVNHSVPSLESDVPAKCSIAIQTCTPCLLQTGHVEHTQNNSNCFAFPLFTNQDDTPPSSEDHFNKLEFLHHKSDQTNIHESASDIQPITYKLADLLNNKNLSSKSNNKTSESGSSSFINQAAKEPFQSEYAEHYNSTKKSALSQASVEETQTASISAHLSSSLQRQIDDQVTSGYFMPFAKFSNNSVYESINQQHPSVSKEQNTNSNSVTQMFMTTLSLLQTPHDVDFEEVRRSVENSQEGESLEPRKRRRGCVFITDSDDEGSPFPKLGKTRKTFLGSSNVKFPELCPDFTKKYEANEGACAADVNKNKMSIPVKVTTSKKSFFLRTSDFDIEMMPLEDAISMTPPTKHMLTTSGYGSIPGDTNISNDTGILDNLISHTDSASRGNSQRNDGDKNYVNCDPSCYDDNGIHGDLLESESSKKSAEFCHVNHSTESGTTFPPITTQQDLTERFISTEESQGFSAVPGTQLFQVTEPPPESQDGSQHMSQCNDEPSGYCDDGLVGDSSQHMSQCNDERSGYCDDGHIPVCDSQLVVNNIPVKTDVSGNDQVSTSAKSTEDVKSVINCVHLEVGDSTSGSLTTCLSPSVQLGHSCSVTISGECAPVPDPDLVMAQNNDQSASEGVRCVTTEAPPGVDEKCTKAEHPSGGDQKKQTVPVPSNCAKPQWMCQLDKTGRNMYINLQTGHTSYQQPVLLDDTDAKTLTLRKSHPMRRCTNSILESFKYSTKKPIITKSKVMMTLSPTSQGQLTSLLGEHQHGRDTEDLQKWGTVNYKQMSTDNKPLDIAEMFKNWDNPVITRAEQDVMNIESRTTSRTSTVVHQALNTCKLTKDMLSTVQVLGQLDKKFILCLLGVDKSSKMMDKSLLIVIDQHAAHERVRLETLIEESYDLCEGHHKYHSLTLDPAIEITLTLDVIRILCAYRTQFKQLGLEFTVLHDHDDVIRINGVPVCLVQREPDQSQRGRTIIAMEIIETFIKEQADLLLATHGANATLPQTFLRSLASEACHGAIRFGEKLTLPRCIELIEELAQCDLPFQCAHGRPSVMPLIDLKKLQQTFPTQAQTKPQLAAFVMRIRAVAHVTA